MNKWRLVFLFFLGLASIGFSQNQLVMIKGEKVLATYKEGDDITLKLKKQNQFKTGYIIKVEDFFIVTNHDTIPLINIDKIDLKRKTYSTRLNVFGTTLATIGLGYFLIDQFNSILVKKQGFDESEAAWKPAAMLVGVGLPMMLIKKKKHHVGWKFKLRAASPGSPFYKY
jgi:hypothetical protein